MAVARKLTGRMFCASVFGVVVVLALHIGSFCYSPEVTIFDFALTVEEGVLAASIPLVAHDDDMPYANSAYIYVYSKEDSLWKIQNTVGAKISIKKFVTYLSAPPTPGVFSGFNGSAAFSLDFGYIYCSDGPYRPERPGGYITLIASIWTLFIIWISTWSAIEFGWFRFSIRTLLFVTAVAAAIIWSMR